MKYQKEWRQYILHREAHKGFEMFLRESNIRFYQRYCYKGYHEFSCYVNIWQENKVKDYLK